MVVGRTDSENPGLAFNEAAIAEFPIIHHTQFMGPSNSSFVKSHGKKGRTWFEMESETHAFLVLEAADFPKRIQGMPCWTYGARVMAKSCWPSFRSGTLRSSLFGNKTSSESNHKTRCFALLETKVALLAALTPLGSSRFGCSGRKF